MSEVLAGAKGQPGGLSSRVPSCPEAGPRRRQATHRVWSWGYRWDERFPQARPYTCGFTAKEGAGRDAPHPRPPQSPRPTRVPGSPWGTERLERVALSIVLLLRKVLVTAVNRGDNGGQEPQAP